MGLGLRAATAPASGTGGTAMFSRSMISASAKNLAAQFGNSNIE